MGRPQFQMLTATLPSESAATVSQTETADIAAGASEQVHFYSPTGTVSHNQVMDFAVGNVAGATGAHTHTLTVDLVGLGVSYGSEPDTDFITFRFGGWIAPATGMPADPNSDSWWLGGRTEFDDTNGITFTYQNNSAHTQTNSRAYQLGVRVVDLP